MKGTLSIFPHFSAHWEMPGYVLLPSWPAVRSRTWRSTLGTGSLGELSPCSPCGHRTASPRGLCWETAVKAGRGLQMGENLLKTEAQGCALKTTKSPIRGMWEQLVAVTARSALRGAEAQGAHQRYWSWALGEFSSVQENPHRLKSLLSQWEWVRTSPSVADGTLWWNTCTFPHSLHSVPTLLTQPWLNTTFLAIQRWLPLPPVTARMLKGKRFLCTDPSSGCSWAEFLDNSSLSITFIPVFT